MLELWLIRHGDTEWSVSGRHTGRTNIALTEHGRQQGARLQSRLAGRHFSLVLTSPLDRASATCGIAGYGDIAHADDDLREWDYGVYEGRTTDEIRAESAAWTIWDGVVPGGETVDQVGERADRVIAKALAVGGEVALFAHGHFLRILAARWLGLPARGGRILALDTGSLSVLGHDGEQRLIRCWNEVCHLGGDR